MTSIRPNFASTGEPGATTKLRDTSAGPTSHCTTIPLLGSIFARLETAAAGGAGAEPPPNPPLHAVNGAVMQVRSSRAAGLDSAAVTVSVADCVTDPLAVERVRIYSRDPV